MIKNYMRKADGVVTMWYERGSEGVKVLFLLLSSKHLGGNKGNGIDGIW